MEQQIKEQVKELVYAMVNEDAVKIQETLESILAKKMGISIAEKTQEVTSNMFAD